MDPIARLKEIRSSMLPLLEAVAREYEPRVRPGYPRIIDNVERGGVFGLNLDANFGIYFMTDGSDVFAEVQRLAHRTDTLSMANVEKFAARPAMKRIEIGPDFDDLQLSNAVSEMLSYWNYQQLAIFRVDS